MRDHCFDFAYECSACGKIFHRNEMDEHHYEYKGREPGPLPGEDNTVLVCRNCHQKIHNVFHLIFSANQKTRQKLTVATWGVLGGWPLDKILKVAREETQAKLNFDDENNYIWRCRFLHCRFFTNGGEESIISHLEDHGVDDGQSQGPTLRDYRRNMRTLKDLEADSP